MNTDNGTYYAKGVVGATGIWSIPYIPDIKGKESFRGTQLHSAFYKSPQEFTGAKVLVVGSGNSGAQILAEISLVTETVWSTLTPPAFLPDDVDGRVLFNIAIQKYLAQKEGKPFDQGRYNLGCIVMVPSVIAAREHSVLYSKGSFNEIYEDGVIWQDEKRENFDIILWCTGFRPATRFLNPLGIVHSDGIIKTLGTKALEIEGLWLVGYGSWTGFASATLIGVGRSAWESAKQVDHFVNHLPRRGRS